MSTLIFDQYEERLLRLRRDRQTVSNFRKARRHFERYLEEIGMSAEDVEPWAIEEHVAALPLAPSTVRTYFQQIRAAYRYAVTRRVLDADPTREVKLPNHPDEEPTIIGNPELREIKTRAWTDRQWIIFHLLTFAGMRLSEVLGLRGEDVDLAAGTMRVTGKFGKIRYVPIHPALGEAFVGHCCVEHGRHIVPGRGLDGRLSQNSFYVEMKEIAPGRTPHDFRRTVTSSLVQNGALIPAVDKIMGWAPRTVRDRYYVNVAPEELQRAILRLYANDPV